MKRVDYDRVAATYDRWYRESGPQGPENAFKELNDTRQLRRFQLFT